MRDRGSDEEAFAAFCRAQHPRLVGILALYVGDRDAAHDLAQETLARIWRDWRRLQGVTSLEAYTYRAAINVAKNHLRRRAVRRRYRHQVEAQERTVHRDADGADAVAVRRAVAALPAKKRAALVLRYFADRSVAQTAVAMDVPENTVKSLTRRALDDLRRELVLPPDTTSNEETSDVR